MVIGLIRNFEAVVICVIYFFGSLKLSFILPKPGAFGICENTYGIQYLNDESYQSCTRKVTLLNACAANTVLDYNYYISNITIFPTPVSSTASITISLNNEVLTNSAAKSSPSYTSSSCTCNNVLQSLEYLVEHDGAGTITGVKANIVLDNLEWTSCSSAVPLV